MYFSHPGPRSVAVAKACLDAQKKLILGNTPYHMPAVTTVPTIVDIPRMVLAAALIRRGRRNW